jgi:hypothetical protein
MSRRALPLALLASLAIVCSACSIRAEANPRDLPEANRAPVGGAITGGDASGAERIYLVEPGEDQLLRSVRRDAASPADLIEILLRGPNDAEIAAQYSSRIPETLELLSARAQGSFLYLDLTEELTELSSAGLVQALAQIVYTASELEGIDSVQITVRGEQRAWPKANLESTFGPLRTYDYPNMVRSAQPAYPSVPGA